MCVRERESARERERERESHEGRKREIASVHMLEVFSVCIGLLQCVVTWTR